jgi:SAM-dependent methyltransferase
MTETIDWKDRYATGDAPWDSGEPSKELCRVLSEHNIAPCRALELGCGTGTNAVYLASRGFTVTALDLVPLASEQARAKAHRARVTVDFRQADVLDPPDLGPAFPFVFDRGVYHHLRNVDLCGFLSVLSRYSQPGGLYLTLAGNANDPKTEKGPPVVRADELCLELSPLFVLVQLREFTFDGATIDGQPAAPLAWSGLLRRKRTA